MTLYYSLQRASFSALIITSLLAGSATEASFTSALSTSASKAAAGASWVRSNPKDTIAIALGLGFLHSIFLFNMREPDTKPNRYELAKLKDWKSLLKNPSAYFNNLWYVYEDGLAGNCFKQSSIKAVWEKDAEGKEKFVMKGKKEQPSRGVYGWIHSRTRPLLLTAKFPLYAAAVLGTTYFGARFYAEVYTTTKELMKNGENPIQAFSQAMLQTTAKYMPKIEVATGEVDANGKAKTIKVAGVKLGYGAKELKY